MAHSLNITDEESRSQMIQDLSISRFQNLGRKYFHFEEKETRNFLKFLTNSAKFYHFHLDESIDELFIKVEEGNYYWAVSSPVNNFVREFNKSSSKNSSETQSNIYNLYTKWIKSKSAEEGRHLSQMVINGLKKCESDDLFNLLVHSMILIYEPEFFDPVKSNEILEKAFEITELGDFNSYSTEVQYLIRLYQGYSNFIDKNFFEANQKFQDALIYKTGISATFYKTLTDFIIIGGDTVNPGLQTITEYDFKRITFALETNNLSVYNYFLKNNIVSNFFHYELLAGLGEEFENFFNEQKFGYDTKTKNLITEFDKFRNLRMDDLDLHEFEVPLNFLEKILHSEQTHKNVLYHSSIDLTKKKFKNIISSIYEFIVAKNYKGIQEKLNYFETESSKIKEKLEKFNREAKTIIEKIKKESKTNIAQLEKKIEHNIAVLDSKLNNLNTHSSYNPFSAFKNSLTYSFVISLLIFLVAGMASYSNNTAGDTTDFQSSFALFITPGIKWGAITFLLGFLFALFSAVSARMERATQKQKIVQRIGYVKNEKERQIEAYNKKRESDIKSVNENLEEIKTEYETQIEKLKQDKIDKENEIKKETDEKIKKESAPLKPFLN